MYQKYPPIKYFIKGIILILLICCHKVTYAQFTGGLDQYLNDDSESSSSSDWVFPISISTGFGNMYNYGLGLNVSAGIGIEDEFAIEPNLGYSVWSASIHGLPRWSYGIRLRSGSFWLGYNYGYIGDEEIDTYFGTQYIEHMGSSVVAGSDLFFDDGDSIWGLTGSSGISWNSGFLNYAFDFGIILRFFD